MKALLALIMLSGWIVLGLFIPGWLFDRLLQTRTGVVGALIGSAVLLMQLVLVLDGARIALTPLHLAVGLTTVCTVLGGLIWLRPALPFVAPRPLADHPPLNWRDHGWLLIPLVMGSAVFAERMLIDPLSGPDTAFRWNFLALQLVREGNLDFYPPVTASHFQQYAWADGIAPLISSLYAHVYLGAGETSRWLTVPVTSSIAVALVTAVWQLARLYRGPAAGWTAIALLPTSAALLYGVAMGQETGFTAFAAVGTLLFLERAARDANPGWLVWAGVAAGAGGLAREYGLFYVVFALGWLGHRRSSWRAFAIVLASAALVAAPWYLRNWVRTGNPFYSHAVGGFAVNAIQIDYFRATREVLGITKNPAAAKTLTLLLGALASVPLLLGLASLAVKPRLSRAWFPLAAGIALLWLWSVDKTSGGYAYSLRVLTPAVALGAVAGGTLLAPHLITRRRWIIAVVLTFAATDACMRSRFLPGDPLVHWWHAAPLDWRTERTAAETWHSSPQWRAIVIRANGEKVLCTDPYDHADLIRQGGKAVALFSPEAASLFGPPLPFAERVAALRQHQIRFLMVTRANPVLDRLLGGNPFFDELRRRQPAAATLLYALYDLQQLSSQARPVPAPWR